MGIASAIIRRSHLAFPVGFSKQYLTRHFKEGSGGGRCEIRTREGCNPLPVFKTGAFNHSANLPRLEL